MLVVGRTTERTALRELSGKLRCNTGVVSVSEIRVRLVDHRLKLRVVPHERVRAHIRRLTKKRVSRWVDVELAANDALQCTHLRLLAAKLTIGSHASNILGVPLLRRGAGYRRAAVLLVLLVVDVLRLLKIVLVRIGQPAWQVHLSRGRRVLRLSATAHDVAPLPCGIGLPCMTRHGGGRGIRKAVRGPPRFL